MMGNHHVRCGAGENLKIISKDYLSLLLINLGVFYDGFGKDVYREVYNHRISVKKKLKTLEFGSVEWHLTNIEQEGYKLILNSASGVLDGSFDTNVRANNKALAMRAIGQMITALIGFALSLEGAIIPSSNTDGIYVYNITKEKNQEILDRELPKLMVTIDPEEVFLVSKDTNNRLEVEDGKVVSARGGTLTSWGGAQIDKRLTHPALVDRILTDYLQNENIVNKPIDKGLIRYALDEYAKNTPKREFVQMASWIMRPTSGSIFIDDKDHVYKGTIRSWLSNKGIDMKRYNAMKVQPAQKFRSYLLDLPDDAPIGEPSTVIKLFKLLGKDEVLARWPELITPAQFYKMEEEYNLTDINGEEKYNLNGKKLPSIPALKEVKIANLNPGVKLHIDNNSLLKMSDEDIETIYNNIDFDAYVDMIADFASVWLNVLQPS